MRNLLPLTGTLLILACGGARVEGRPATHTDFAHIALHEATLEDALAALARADPGRRCQEAERGCRAAQAICDVAGPTHDADAWARCEAAQQRCGAARRRACAEEPPH